MYTIKLWGLALLLTFAGIIHLASPETFLITMPAIVPFRIPIILVTGLLELTLAVGILLPRFRNLFAQITAMYCIAIWPVHFYMAIWNVPLGNLDSPIVLWGRVLLQIPLIYWAYSLRRPTLR